MPMFSTLAGALIALLLDGPFNYEFSRVTDEKSQAHVILRANEDLQAMEVTITGDRQTIRKKIPALKSGKEYKIVWTQNGDTAAYEMAIVSSAGEANANFEVARGAGKPSGGGGGGGGAAGKVTAMATAADILYDHKVAYTTSFEVSGYEFKVYNTDGDVIHNDAGTGGWKAGERIELRWNTTDDVFLVKVRFEGAQGQFGEHILAPMAIDIPHTEVVFDSGKAIIRGEQAPKIDEAAAVAMHKLAAVENAKKAVGNVLEGAGYVPKLFIAGYTDTVGKPGDNQKLSEGRARAIAERFHEKGVWSEIYYTGMGEKGLKVQTPDSFDEEKNRRAVYVISFQPPTGPWFPSPGAWKKVANARPRPAELPPYPEKWKEYEDNKRHGKTDGGSSSSEGSGGGSSSSSDTSSGSDDGSGTSGSSGGSGGEPYLGSAEGPPEVGGEPGASKKGCSVVADPTPGATILLLAGLLTLRRRRVRAA
ncbi:MYXO-CTERM domain-containing protein [Nannocystis exedens]|uniref:MYXO-CTERM domain-containing protein n=1 Tax=Nannocystis exedens TaxID=54 RepID=A0A1I1Z4E0_9BACT|nr:OmpA family protein [Nannocystis exedens]PCC75169.1 OmpA family protein [Nannocystis exedens]SFE26537.1 MYXO-CTERM domain-containing protein [Nannocystis exedens]